MVVRFCLGLGFLGRDLTLPSQLIKYLLCTSQWLLQIASLGFTACKVDISSF